MATCSVCGRDYGFFGGGSGRCDDCIKKRFAEAERIRQALSDKVGPDPAEAERLVLAAKAARIILTTETTAPDLIIAERLGIVSAECVFGMHMFKDIFAIGRDIFGGRSGAVQNTLKDARKTALEELRFEAAQLGADAVIAVNLDYSEISGGGKSMLFLVATGTAVKLDQMGNE